MSDTVVLLDVDTDLEVDLEVVMRVDVDTVSLVVSDGDCVSDGD